MHEYVCKMEIIAFIFLELILGIDEARGLKSCTVLTSVKGRYSIMTEAASHCVSRTGVSYLPNAVTF